MLVIVRIVSLERLRGWVHVLHVLHVLFKGRMRTRQLELQWTGPPLRRAPEPLLPSRLTVRACSDPCLCVRVSVCPCTHRCARCDGVPIRHVHVLPAVSCRRLQNIIRTRLHCILLSSSLLLIRSSARSAHPVAPLSLSFSLPLSRSLCRSVALAVLFSLCVQ